MGAGNSAVALDGNQPENQGWDEWPLSQEVAGELGLTTTQLLGYVNRGWLVRYRCPDSKVRCRPLDVESFRVRLLSEARNKELEDAESISELKHVLRQTVALLKQCQTHNRELWELHVKAPMTAIDLLKGIVGTQKDRIRELEEAHDGFVRTREELLSMAHERELMTQDFAHKAANRREITDRALNALENAAPGLAKVIASNLGLKLPEDHPAVALMKSIDPELARMLIKLDVLSPEQIRLLRELFPDLDEASQSEERSAPSAEDAPAGSPAENAGEQS